MVVAPAVPGACRRVAPPTYPGTMLIARRASVWRSRFEILADDEPVASWDGAIWSGGGDITIEGRHYRVRGNAWGTRYAMTDDHGVPVATADRVGRKQWSVEADGRAYEFRRASFLSGEQELHSGGRRVGSVRRCGRWKRDVAADLPGMPLPVQLFVLGTVITMWEAQSATMAATAG